MRTPGTWKAEPFRQDELGEARCGIYAEDGPGQVYAVAKCPRFTTKEQWEADSARIVAVNDLLEVLKSARKHILGAEIRVYPNDEAIIGQIDAAIAKAEGM